MLNAVTIYIYELKCCLKRLTLNVRNVSLYSELSVNIVTISLFIHKMLQINNKMNLKKI